MPPHIAQLVAGHRDINTTMGYKAVYPDEVINGHRAFIARRRALRPSEEYRVPTEQEWERVPRPLRTPQALPRAPAAAPTPPRASTNTPACAARCCAPTPHNAPGWSRSATTCIARIAEARQQGWLGEVDGLQISLTGAREKLAQLDQIAAKTTSTHLGMPTFPQIAGRSAPPPTRWSDCRRRRPDGRAERSSSSAENKGTYGHHPLGAWCDNTREALALRLRPGNAGSNTAADHIAVLGEAIAQIPDPHRRDLLITVDGAGATLELIRHITALNTVHGRRVHYSVGFDLDHRARTAIALVHDATGSTCGTATASPATSTASTAPGWSS